MNGSQSIPTWTTEYRLFVAQQMQGLLANPSLTNKARLLEQDLPLIARTAILATNALVEALDVGEGWNENFGIPTQYVFEPVRCALRYGGNLMGLGLFDDVQLKEGDRVLVIPQSEIYIASSHQWQRTNELVHVTDPVVIPVRDGFFMHLCAVRKRYGKKFEMMPLEKVLTALDSEDKIAPDPTAQNQVDVLPSLTQEYNDESVSADFDKIAHYCLRGGIGNMINDIQQFCAHEAKERLESSDDQRLEDAAYWCRLANKLREAWELAQ